MSEKKPERLYRLKEILDRIPISKSAWYAGIKAGKFPKPVKLGPRTSCWRESDLAHLIERGVVGEDAA